MKKRVCAVICAAGKGLRAGFDKNKLLFCVDGISVLERTVQAFYFEGIDEIIVTYSPDDLKEMQAALSGFDNIKFVQGGDTRTASVYNALQAVESEIVLIHDGARPFVSRKVIEGCVQSVLEFGSGICAVPCTDTMGVKGTTNELIRVPDRNLLVRIQTPQGFFTKDILGASEHFTSGLYKQELTPSQSTLFCIKFATSHIIFLALSHSPLSSESIATLILSQARDRESCLADKLSLLS